MDFRYSIIIRTLGNTGDKYKKTLQCISMQSVKPEEIIVVIPNGYILDHSLGSERIIRTEKGMVTQRAIGIIEASSPYLLVLDDDISFPADFVEKMFKFMVGHSLDCVLAFGSGHDVIPYPSKPSRKQKMVSILKVIRGAYTGQYFLSNKQSDFFDIIAPSGGHKSFINCSDKLCQTGCFQCFLIKNEQAKAVHFEDDLWLEQGTISRYSAYDDAVFFYKAYLNGCRIAYANTTDYTHLDAGAGRKAMSKLESKRIRLYSIARNRTIFWHKYLLQKPHKDYSHTRIILAGFFSRLHYRLYNYAINIFPKYWPAIKAMEKGYSDAWHIIRKS